MKRTDPNGFEITNAHTVNLNARWFITYFPCRFSLDSSIEFVWVHSVCPKKVFLLLTYKSSAILRLESLTDSANFLFVSTRLSLILKVEGIFFIVQLDCFSMCFIGTQQFWSSRSSSLVLLKIFNFESFKRSDRCYVLKLVKAGDRFHTGKQFQWNTQTPRNKVRVLKFRSSFCSCQTFFIGRVIRQ